MATSLNSLLAMSVVFSMCFFVCGHYIRRERPRALRVRNFHGISSHLIKAMPKLIFTWVVEDNSTSVICAICLKIIVLEIIISLESFHSSIVSYPLLYRLFAFQVVDV